MKKIILTALIAASYAPAADIVVHCSPDATLRQSQISVIAPQIVKITTASTPGSAYIFEHKGTLGEQAWQTLFVAEAATDEAWTSRTAYLPEPEGYFRVLKAAVYGPEEQANWNVWTDEIFPDASYLWTWENTGGTDTNHSPSKAYTYAGVKSAEVAVMSNGSNVVSKRWAIAVTNPPSINLLANGDFEIVGFSGNPVAWSKDGYGSNTATYTYPVLGPDGSKAARVIVANYASGDAKWYHDDVAVAAGKTYHYQSDYRSDVPTHICVRYTMANDSNVYIDYAWPQASTNWTTVSAYFTAISNSVSVTVFHIFQANGTLDVDNAFLSEVDDGLTELPEGLVSLDFDDGRRNAFRTSHQMLTNAGFRATYNLVTDYIGQSWNVTDIDLFNMRLYGHEISIHTKSHADLVALGDTDLVNEINKPINDFGFHGKANIAFCYPYGSYNDRVKKAVREAGCLCARSTDTGYNQKGQTDLFALKGREVRTETTIGEITGWIDEARTNQAWLIIIFHRVDTNNPPDDLTTTPAVLQQTINYLLATNTKVVTASQGARLLSTP